MREVGANDCINRGCFSQSCVMYEPLYPYFFKVSTNMSSNRFPLAHLTCQWYKFAVSRFCTSNWYNPIMFLKNVLLLKFLNKTKILIKIQCSEGIFGISWYQIQTDPAHGTELIASLREES